MQSSNCSLNPMRNDNRFKLGIFSTNADGGLAFTTVDERWRVDWDDSAAVAQMADQAGFEFILPIARWKGYGGATNVRHASFETLTHAAAVAAITQKIAVFSTVHVPLVHPVFAAKSLMTIDHVSKGRSGLNIVCGWNQDEFDMFGHRQPIHDVRYDQGLEWYTVLSKIFEGSPAFDYRGAFYDLKGVIGAPRPLQAAGPFTISAAFSPAGRQFAAKTSDGLFTPLREAEKASRHISEIEAMARAAGRAVKVFTTCHVVCRETDREAQDYYDHYAVEMADKAAVERHMKAKTAHYESIDPDIRRVEQRRFAGGTGTHPLIGSPERIVDEMIAIQRLGFAGTTVSFVNFKNELPFFIDRVLPLMEQAGLRRPVSASA